MYDMPDGQGDGMIWNWDLAPVAAVAATKAAALRHQPRIGPNTIRGAKCNTVYTGGLYKNTASCTYRYGGTAVLEYGGTGLYGVRLYALLTADESPIDTVITKVDSGQSIGSQPYVQLYR
jgi:hypothetical protein